jgi:hypothetical protein
MEVTKRKREEQGWECRNGLTPPRSDHFLLRQTDRNHRKSLLPVRGYPGFIQGLFQSGSYHPASRGKSSAVTRRRESIPQRQPRRQRPALPIGSSQGFWADSRSAPFRANACALCRFSAICSVGSRATRTRTTAIGAKTIGPWDLASIFFCLNLLISR